MLLHVWAFAVVGLAIRAFADGLLATRARPDEPTIVPIAIDVNRAGVDELQALPGIGPERARAIVLERVRRGPFRDVADLDRVDGLGAGAVEALRPFARVEPEPAAATARR